MIYETHPVLEVFDPHCATPNIPVFSYFDTQPHIESGLITYGGRKAASTGKSYWFTHRLGAILNAAIAAGLQIIELEEFLHSIREVDYDIYARQSAQMPICYFLQALKP